MSTNGIGIVFTIDGED